MDNIHIRVATEGDVAAVYNLQQMWTEEHITLGYGPATEADICTSIGPYLLVAEADREIIGFIGGSAHVSEGMAVIPERATYLEVNDLYVVPHFRQRKVGSQLVEELLATGRRLGASYALLYSSTKDIRRILKFYEEHGFQSWNVQMYQQL